MFSNKAINSSTRNIRILSVNHSIDFHKITELMLKSFRYLGSKIHLVNALNVSQATNFMRTNEFAIALIEVDSKMGKPTGLDFVDIVRNEINNKDIRLILVAGDCTDISKYDLVVNYDVNSFLDKNEFVRENLFTNMTIALREYDRIIQNKENYERMEILMEFTKKHTQYKGLDYIIKAVYNYLIKEKYIESVAVYKNHQLYFCSGGESEFVEIHKKWIKTNEEIIEEFFIIRVREFGDYVIIARTLTQNKELSIQYSINLVGLATAARNNIISIVKNDKLLLDLYYISANSTKILFIKVKGRNSELYRVDMDPEEINQPIKTINSFFSDDLFIQINRSIVISTKKIKAIKRYSSRKICIELINKQAFDVSRGNLAKVENQLGHLLKRTN